MRGVMIVMPPHSRGPRRSGKNSSQSSGGQPSQAQAMFDQVRGVPRCRRHRHRASAVKIIRGFAKRP